MKKNHKLILIALAVATGLFILIGIIINLKPSQEDVIQEDDKVEEIHKTEYGFIVDTLKIERGKVKRNQFLSDILLKYDVDYGTIDQLAKASKAVFDVRKIRTGKSYAVIQTNDSIQKALYFIYEESATDYIVYNLHDSIHVYRGEKPVQVNLKSTGGVIHSSLWETMVNNGTDPNLANEMSEIFAWTIDFFGIQAGDYYKVMYEELIVDNKVIGIGKIHSGMFHHQGHDYYAFFFETKEKGDYYDDEGGSMRRTFLKAPLRFRRISSGFSYSRMHPVLKIRRPHTGVDYAADAGTPVYTVGDGVVIKKGWDKKGGGNYVKIKHNGTYTTVYMHLQGFSKGLKTGKHVKQGEVIGYVGKTGIATGPHLDFRFYRNDKPIDPLKVKSPPAEPVDTAYQQAFFHLVDSLTIALDSIPVSGINAN